MKLEELFSRLSLLMVVLAIAFFLLSYSGDQDRNLFSGGATGSVNITVTNTDVNFIRNISDLTIAQNDERRVNFSAYFQDPEGVELNYTLIPSPVRNITFEISDNGQTNITTNDTGPQEFVVVNASDGNSLVLSNNFTILLVASTDENGEMFKEIDIAANTEWALNMTSNNLIIDTIFVKPANFVSNVSINVTHRINTTIDDQGDNVDTANYVPFAYMNFNTKGLDSALSTLQLDFRVSKYFITLNALDEDTVTLWSYDGATYSEVTTIKSATETNDDFFYSATPSNFTLFAITADAVTTADGSLTPSAPTISGGISGAVGAPPLSELLERLFPPPKVTPLGFDANIQDGFKNILPGNIIRLDIAITQPVTNAKLTYQLVDSLGNFVLLGEETVSTIEDLEFVKTLEIPPEIAIGQYSISVEMVADGQSFVRIDDFAIVRTLPLIIPSLNTIVLILLLAILFAEVRYLLATDKRRHFAR